MKRYTRQEFVPRKGNVLRVVGVARISTENQDERSLDDQEALYKRWLGDHVEVPYELMMISSQGSGERVDRAELHQLEAAIESQQYDLVLTEDLGRISRRVQAFLICELCEDTSTRLIAINDSIDTGGDDWRLHTFFASMRHESYNRDTAKRIRRSLRNRFLQGGALVTPPFCIYKPPGAKHDSELQKIVEMEPIVEEMFRLLETGAPFSEVADWLNSQQIPLGRGARTKRWTGKLVRETVFNPILKGVRERNNKISVRLNKTGRRRSVKAPPEELLKRDVPHLSFIEPQRYDQLVKKLVRRGELYSVPKRKGIDPRKGRPKKRTKWPGQQVRCGVCGQPFVYGGHGQASHLMCSGARSYDCWNGVTFDGPLAASKMSTAIMSAIAELPEFDEILRAIFDKEAKELSCDRDRRRQQVQQQLAKLERAGQRLTRALREEDDPPKTIMDELRSIEAERVMLHEQLEGIDAEDSHPLALPTVDQLREEVLTEIQPLALESAEFGRTIAKIVPELRVFPVRLCDGGHVYLRAELKLSLGVMVSQKCQTASVVRHLQRTLVVDLFEMPQRVAFRTQVIAMRAAGMTEQAVAKQLGITVTAAQRAAALDRLMKELGISDPLVRVDEPPEDYNRLRRHRHKRYQQRSKQRGDAA